MNDSISVTPSLISPGSGFAPAGGGLLAGEAGLAGLNGAFSQLLALSMPVEDGGAVNGQALPTVGTALPLESPEAGSQLAAFLDDFAGDTIPEEMLSQLREQGISRQQLADVVHLLERSDIARMPAIAEMVSQIKDVIKELEGQQPAVEGGALTPLATSDEGVDALDESGEGNAQAEVTDGALSSDADEVGIGLSDRQVVEPSTAQAQVQASQAQSQVQASQAQAQVQASQAQAQVQASQAQAQVQASQAQPQVQADQAQPQVQADQAQPQAQTAQTQAQIQASQAQAQELGLGVEKKPAPQASEARASSVDKAQSITPGVGDDKGVAGQEGRSGESKERSVRVVSSAASPVDNAAKIKNTAMADLMKSQQAAASAATGTLLSDAEQLMSRLTAAAQQARPGVSAGVLQGMAVADSQARQVELSRAVSIPGTGPMSQQVAQMPAQAAGSVPVAQPSVNGVEAGVSVLASSQLKKESVDAASTRRSESVQLSGSEGRGGGVDVTVKAQPSVSVSPTNVFASSGSDGPLPVEQAGVDKGGDEGRVREGSERVVTVARQSGEQTMQPHQLVMSGRPPMASPAWSGTLNNHVMWLATQNNKVAEIQLDPPELGSLQVKIRVSQDQVSVSFVSPHASVRDAVEQSMARLRDMFEEQGLNLAESSVDDQSAQQHGGRDGMEGFEADEGHVQDGDGDAESAVGSAQAHAVSLVDYYA